jgi:hypothetical protein
VFPLFPTLLELIKKRAAPFPHAAAAKPTGLFITNNRNWEYIIVFEVKFTFCWVERAVVKDERLGCTLLLLANQLLDNV